MTTPPAGAQFSEDGHYWWDEPGQQWQLVDHAAMAAASAAPAAGSAAAPAAEPGSGPAGGTGGSGGSGSADAGAPAKPAEIVLVGVASFDPLFPQTGHEIVYTWGEENIGGPSAAYHARVEFKDPDGNILNADKVLVECEALATNQQASRTTTLPAPTKAAIGYSIELWVDVDHAQGQQEGLNYAYHNVDVSDPS